MSLIGHILYSVLHYVLRRAQLVLMSYGMIGRWSPRAAPHRTPPQRAAAAVATPNAAWMARSQHNAVAAAAVDGGAGGSTLDWWQRRRGRGPAAVCSLLSQHGGTCGKSQLSHDAAERREVLPRPRPLLRPPPALRGTSAVRRAAPAVDQRSRPPPPADKCRRRGWRAAAE